MQNFMGSLTKAHAFLNKVQAPAPPLDMPMLIKTFASAQDVADIRAQVDELGQAFDDNLMDQTPIESILLETVPPATGENPGIQLTVSAPAAPAVHPNSREGRALRAAAKAAAAEMAGAV